MSDLQKERSEFYEQLGIAITQWTHVEDAMFTNFMRAISKKRESNLAAQAAFYAIQSPEGKIAMAKSAVTFRLLQGMTEDPKDKRRIMMALWENLCTRAHKRRNRRNLLAHFQVLTDTQAKPGKRISLRPPLFNPNAILASRRIWHCAELAATAGSFGKLNGDLLAFAEGFSILLEQHEGPPLRAELLSLLLRQLEGRSYEGPGLPPESSQP
jgi:hypothetical protein